MTADVNVTEKVARALFEHRLATGDFVDGPTAWDDLPEPWRDEWHEGAAAALSALADPEVQAGMAGVLREHRMAWSTYTRRVVCRGCDFMATGILEQEEARQIEERHQVAEAVEWLRGRAL